MTTARALPNTLAIPPEIIEYIEEGRNPDIYTREFVELAQTRNQLLGGTAAAFAAFRDVLATEIEIAIPELKNDIGRLTLHPSTKEEEPRVNN